MQFNAEYQTPLANKFNQHTLNIDVYNIPSNKIAEINPDVK
jgi:hypothetical protein